MDKAKGAESQVCPDPMLVPENGPDEQRHAQEANSPEDGRATCTGPPPDWLRRSQRGVPEHWLSLVRKHAPELLEPVVDRDDRVSAVHRVMGKDGLEPMGAFEHQPIRDPEDIREMQGFPMECGDLESNAIHLAKGVDPKSHESTSRPNGRSLGDSPQPVQGQEYIPRMSKKAPRVNHSRTARIESSTDSPGSIERSENGVVLGIRRETVQANAIHPAKGVDPKPHKSTSRPSGRSLGDSSHAVQGQEYIPRMSKKAPRVNHSRTARIESPTDSPGSIERLENGVVPGIRRETVQAKPGVQRLLLAPRVNDPEGSFQGWEKLLESLSLNLSPELSTEIPARRWPELMEGRDMDFYDHRTVFDEREKREVLMREQDGAPWSV